MSWNLRLRAGGDVHVSTGPRRPDGRRSIWLTIPRPVLINGQEVRQLVAALTRFSSGDAVPDDETSEEGGRKGYPAGRAVNPRKPTIPVSHRPPHRKGTSMRPPARKARR